SWQDLLPGFTATQHLMGSHVINIQDNMASCLAHCQATHILDEEQWVLGGLYNFQLTLNSGTWLITSITMTALWSVGNQAKLLELASARAAASSNKK
ncbi:MAG: nuclear transport factor 2 family protein, partial [Chloroflexota bacterium]